MLNFEKLSNIPFLDGIIEKLSLESEISLSGFFVGETSLLIKNYTEKKNKKIVLLAPDLIFASNIESMLSSFEIKCEVISDNFNYSEKNSEKNKKIAEKNAKKLNNFVFSDFSVLILTANCLNLNVNKNNLKSLKIEKNQEINRDEFIKQLVDFGYVRVFESPENLEFVASGDVINIQVDGKKVRVDFFGDFIDEVVVDNEKVLEFSFNSYSIFDENANDNILNFLSEDENNTLFVYNPKQLEDEIFYYDVEEENNKIVRNKTFSKENFLIKIREKWQKIAFFNEYSFDYVEKRIQNQNVGARKYLYDYNSLLSDLIYYEKSRFIVVLFCGSKNSKKSICDFLSKKIYCFDFEKDAKQPGVFLSEKYVPNSLSFLEDKIVVIGTEDLVRGNTKQKIVTKKNIYLPKIGDYVVHELHGIGKCVQIERLKILNHEKDYVVVEYKNGDRLYVPSEQLNLLSAYIGAEEQPKLNLIGGVEFGRQKEKVKNSIKKLTFDLLSLYSEREKRKGFVYKANDYLYDEFVNAFPYEETEDQLRAEKEIIKDMESPKILDRLVCGDVGYGKTEVALRAAYKAVLSGRQVAFLCPTTVLSEQHYNTCKERFKNFMVRIEVLNRFKSAAEVKDILERLKNGEIDILCGTHKILGKNVEFKNLSLLILDEEHKFGVEQKEKIKNLKKDIDILSLSATPIPRTLQMSLSGIRDISLIETPPKNRLPVQTYVTEYNEKILVDACEKELNRNGQVFIIYNEIKTIDEFARRVRELIPNAEIGVAHAQMNEKILKQTVDKLYNREYDIIISTTLIENGIDNPFANTLIVIDADKLGLSELYQLRGRVGRSDRLAFAYFTYKPQKVLTETAYKRLEALSEFTELGSGFKIAMRDLEIRGAGDLLGREQHGHLSKLGFDLYNKLIQESIEEIRGNKKEELLEIKIEVDIDAFISNEYITSESDRIEYYSKISELSNSEDFNKLRIEMETNFGEIPMPTINLMKIGLLKNLAQKNYVKKIVLNSLSKKFVLYKLEKIVTDQVAIALKKFQSASLKFSSLPEIVFENNLSIYECLQLMIDFLTEKN